MDFRPAVENDVDAIASFTTGTFEWGDYVPYAIAEWIGADDSVVMVATDQHDTPVAIGRCALLTPHEAWLHAARVDPDHRGKGIAGTMAVVLTDWARDEGALVARLLIEDDNIPSINHINKTAFRRTVTVHRGQRSLTQPGARRNGNGGRRRRSSLVAREGAGIDAEMVVASWTSSVAGRALRGLVAKSWSFHRLRTDDVRSAAADGMLWEVGGSWAIAREVDGTFEVLMVDASPADAEDTLRALIDLAHDRGAERFSAWVANQPSLVDALKACGCEIVPNGVYAQPL
jgi:GNAT superfamily N-acetyltransferase